MQLEVQMTKSNDLNMSLVPFKQDACVVAVVELSQSSWLIAAAVPWIERQPLKKLEPDEEALLRLLHAAGATSRRERTRDQPHRCRLRSRARWILAGAVAATARN